MNGFEKCQMEILVRLLRFANDFYSKADRTLCTFHKHAHVAKRKESLEFATRRNEFTNELTQLARRPAVNFDFLAANE